jgi:hypothetical protein
VEQIIFLWLKKYCPFPQIFSLIARYHANPSIGSAVKKVAKTAAHAGFRYCPYTESFSVIPINENHSIERINKNNNMEPHLNTDETPYSNIAKFGLNDSVV